MNIFGWTIVPTKALRDFHEAAFAMQAGISTINNLQEKEWRHSMMHQAMIEQELGNLVRQTDNNLAKALQSIAREERELLEVKLNMLKRK